jgi:flagella basal body P-ring formation protein FlgA
VHWLGVVGVAGLGCSLCLGGALLAMPSAEVRALDQERRNVENALVEVWVAAEQLPVGRRIRREQLEVRKVAPDWVPALVLTAEDVVGRAPQSRILVNEYLREGRFQP